MRTELHDIIASSRALYKRETLDLPPNSHNLPCFPNRAYTSWKMDEKDSKTIQRYRMELLKDMLVLAVLDCMGELYTATYIRER